MSFGISTGDFITIGQLSLKLYRRCKDAPGEFQDITRELSLIHTTISSMFEQSKDPASLFLRQGEEKIPEWTKILEDLKTPLSDLEELVKTYESLGKNAWRRVRLGGELLADLRAKLAFHLNVMNTFVASLELSTLGGMEPVLGRIEPLLRESLREKLLGNRHPTVLSAHRTDQESWKRMEMDLLREGVPQQDLLKYKEKIQEIRDWLVKHSSDLPDLVDATPGDSASSDSRLSYQRPPSRSSTLSHFSIQDDVSQTSSRLLSSGSALITSSRRSTTLRPLAMNLEHMSWNSSNSIPSDSTSRKMSTQSSVLSPLFEDHDMSSPITILSNTTSSQRRYQDSTTTTQVTNR